MQERPEGLADAEVAAAVAQHWGLAVPELRYLPVGFGGYHWSARDADGGRWFVTATDLARFDSFADLERAMSTAVLLARAGLEFVLAPVPTGSGRAACPVGSRYGITVAPFAAGIPGRWGDAMTAADLAAVTGMLARVHAVRADPADVPVRAVELPDRAVIDTSLRERAEPWQSGPYGEPTRAVVNEHAASLAAALEALDELTAELTGSAGELVITHGEPHAGNLIRAGNGLLLIDCDMAGLALPERDLWWIVSESGAEAALYAELTGRAVSETALSFYRLRWDLADLAEFLPWFRGPHERSADAETAWRGLAGMIARLAGRYPG